MNEERPKYSSYLGAENQNEILHFCPIRRETRERKLKPCYRQRCPCRCCRRAWSRRQATIRQRSFQNRPPTHTLVIHPPDGPTWCNRKAKFVDRLKYQFRR